MKKNVRKPLINFYDANQSEREGYVPSTPHSSTHSHDVTVVVEESSISSISNPSGGMMEESFPKFITVATPTLHNLEEAVVQARLTLKRFDVLILQAVWKCILHNSHKDESEKRPFPNGGSKPLSVQQRRAQLIAEAQPPFNTQSSGLRLFSSKLHKMSSKRQASNYLSCTRPFLPTSRYPVIAQLNPKERAQFNRDLCDAIKETRRSGLIKSVGAQESSENTRVRASSLRSIALKFAMEKNNAKLSESTSNPKSSSPVSASVSFLIVEVAKKRALAVFFLRQLRLQAYQRHLLLEEFQCRHTYRLQWSTFRRWCACAWLRRSHRKSLLKHVVDHWQGIVARRKCLRSLMQRFHAGLIDRLCATKILKSMQQRSFFVYWCSKFTKKRVMSAMSDAADSFRLSKDKNLAGGGGAVPKKIYLSMFSSKDTFKEVKKSGCSHVLRCAYRHWRDKTNQRLKIRLAEWRCAQYMKKHVFKKLKQAANQNRISVLTQETPHLSLLPILKNDSVGAGELSFSGVDGMFSQRCRTISGMPSSPELWCYKEKMGLRVMQTTLLQRAFRQWRQHYLCRRSRLHYVRKVQLSTMRLWMNLLACRRIRRATCQDVWHCWRERLHRLRLEDMAADVHVRSSVSRTFYTWRLNFMFRSRNSMVTMRWCLQKWWERAALRIGVRTLTIHHRQRLFCKWRARAIICGRRRALLLLSDTLRETILLVGCVRVWWKKVRGIQKMRALCGIIEQLNLEHRREECFLKWKRKVFKSTSLLHVVTVTKT